MKLSDRLREAESKRRPPMGHIAATCGCCGPQARQRATKRDHWNKPAVKRFWLKLELLGLCILAAMFYTVGSLNF